MYRPGRSHHPIEVSVALWSVRADSDRRSIEHMDCERDREAERRRDPDPPASVLEGLGHHRVRKHGQDRARREGDDEGDGGREEF